MRVCATSPVVAATVGGCLAVVFVGLLLAAGRAEAQPVAPKQPILFSHKIHAGEFRIACQYCHSEARRSQYAGIPSVRRCMGCHQIVQSKDAELQKEVQKLQALWKDGRPVEWVRVHKVAGFVYFSHKRHVQAEVTCQTCHGAVEEMTEVARVAPLTMGWCVSCHAERKAPLDCVVCHH